MISRRPFMLIAQRSVPTSAIKSHASKTDLHRRFADEGKARRMAPPSFLTGKHASQCSPLFRKWHPRIVGSRKKSRTEM